MLISLSEKNLLFSNLFYRCKAKCILELFPVCKLKCSEILNFNTFIYYNNLLIWSSRPTFSLKKKIRWNM